MTTASRTPRDRIGRTAPVALAVALTLAPGAAGGLTAGDFAGIFRQVCLERLPDFSGSDAALVWLGFAKNGERYERNLSGEKLAVKIGPPDEMIGYSCMMSATISREGAVTSVLAEIIAEMTSNQFRHRGVPVKRSRVEIFNWRSDEREVLVMVGPENGPLRLVIVTTAESDR